MADEIKWKLKRIGDGYFFLVSVWLEQSQEYAEITTMFSDEISDLLDLRVTTLKLGKSDAIYIEPDGLIIVEISAKEVKA